MNRSCAASFGPLLSITCARKFTREWNAALRLSRCVFLLQSLAAFFSILARSDAHVISFERPQAACFLPFAYLALQIGTIAPISCGASHETSFEHEAAQDDARCRPREVNMEARVSTSVSRVLRTPRINSISSIHWTCIRIGIFPGCRVGAHHSLALSAWSLTNVRVTHTVRRPGTLKDYATPTISVTCTHRVLQRHHALSMLRLLD